MGHEQLAIVGADVVVAPRNEAYASATRGRIASIVLACAIASVGSGHLWLKARVETITPFVPPLNVYALFVNATPVPITLYAGGEYAPWLATAHAIQTDIALWWRMHLANWNGVPQDLRVAGLDAMLTSYRSVLTNPRIWDRMTADDWDQVPQPVRTVAYRQMVAYWTGFYDIGRRHHLQQGLVSDTTAAIVMSESWFDHRAVQRDRSGNTDIGLAQASDFARERVKALYRAGIVDVDLTTNDYFNPWTATRFVVLWFGLLLDEASGSIDVAVRAYNRGIANAYDDRGSAYLAVVKQRLHRFIRNGDAPAAWAHVWRRARTIEQDEWPWMSSEGRGTR